MTSRRCTAYLDTSILWLATHLSHPASHMARAMLYRIPCTLVYTELYLELDLRSQSIPKQHARRILNLAADVARPLTPLGRKAELVARGRYGKTIRSLGVIDVLIAVRAKTVGAILVTADWAQARFYINIAEARARTANRGQPIVYIPVRLMG